MLSSFGWRQTFLSMAAVGLLWVITWYALFRDRPEDHWAVSEAEVQKIIAGRTISAAQTDPTKHGSVSHQGRLWPVVTQRSEEHTSETQSLMRISQAAFCLKKQKTK